MQQRLPRRFYRHSQRLGATCYRPARYIRTTGTTPFYDSENDGKTTQTSLVFSAIRLFWHHKQGLSAMQGSLVCTARKPPSAARRAALPWKGAFSGLATRWNRSFGDTFPDSVFSKYSLKSASFPHPTRLLPHLILTQQESRWCVSRSAGFTPTAHSDWNISAPLHPNMHVLQPSFLHFII